MAQQERLEQNAKEEKLNGIAALRGCLSEYANPKLWEKEEDAWAGAVAEKYALR